MLRRTAGGYLTAITGLAALLNILQAQSIGKMGSPRGDTAPLHDPMRPVMEIGQTSVVLQYFTATPCETRVQIRAGNLPAAAWR
ncbi:MAG: hypothetical protein NZL85_11210, partial [Fimbriimonadales bacterium]|nr:hypothetical protein [Fimbriimonadales bacterium]